MSFAVSSVSSSLASMWPSSVFAARRGGSPSSFGQASTSTDSQEGFKVDATFSAETVRRIAANYKRQDASATGDATAAAAKTAPGPAQLSDSLTRTVDFIRENYGDQAATAFMGVIAAHVGDGKIDETRFGQGMLAGIKLIDRGFGFAAGDQVIANMNGDLNQAVNRFFDNGQNEVIYSLTASGLSVDSALSDMAAKARQSLGQTEGQGVADLIKETLASGTGDDLDKVIQKIRDQYGQKADSLLASLRAGLSGDQELTPGLLLDQRV